MTTPCRCRSGDAWLLCIIHTQQQLQYIHAYVDEVSGVTRWAVLHVIYKVAINLLPVLTGHESAMCPRADANYCIGIHLYVCMKVTQVALPKIIKIIDKMHQTDAEDRAFLHIGAQYHRARVVSKLDPILSHLQSTIAVLPHLTLMNDENVFVHLILQFTKVMSTHVRTMGLSYAEAVRSHRV